MYLSAELKRILGLSRDEAQRLGNDVIIPDHLMLAILRDGTNKACVFLRKKGVDLNSIKTRIDNTLYNPEPAGDNTGHIPFSIDTQNILNRVSFEAKLDDAPQAGSIHLLCALMENNCGAYHNLLSEQGITYSSVTNEVRSTAKALTSPQSEEETIPDDSLLSRFGKDLTQLAAEGKLDPVTGRARELERIIRILGRRRKNNPIIIGESGVGKTAMADALAQSIKDMNVPSYLLNKRIISLHIPSILAGTKYRGEFEERMTGIVQEATNRKDVILFIDEVHSIVGTGNSEGTMDAANILKPALSRGDIQFIGATTTDHYSRLIEKDASLESRFQKVMIEEADAGLTMEILKGLRERYETHHNVRYTDQALEACITLTQRYISNRALPDKAIDAMDEAGSLFRAQNGGMSEKRGKLIRKITDLRAEKYNCLDNNDMIHAAEIFRQEKKILREIEKEAAEPCDDRQNVITEQHIEAVVSSMSGVPVSKVSESDITRLLKMDKRLKARIIGQDEAVESVVRAVKRSKSGLKDQRRPIGTFAFFGPTGVGKTELAKAIAAELFDSEESLIRIDLSEFGDKMSASRLTGAAPGYVGYEKGGELTSKVRKKPYSVVLFDEIEKANPDIFNVLLQILEEGRLTDGRGRLTDFRNCIIILTSNAGSRELEEYGNGIGFQTREDTGKEGRRLILDKAIKRIFPPEFLNRIDATVYFNRLTENDILAITDIEIRKLISKAAEAGFKVSVSEKARKYIAAKGFDPVYGARPLRRAIQKYIEDPLADAILEKAAYRGHGKFSITEDRKGEIRIGFRII